MSINNSILNRLFTQCVFRDILRKRSNNTFRSVVKRYVNNPESKSNEMLISEIYDYLSNNYRNEYFYQNTLLNKLLIGKHSFNTTTALTQVPISKSKADFILINGKAVVYEIKTELDSFERLENQITDYYKAFDRVCVVSCESNYDRLFSLFRNTSVGIYTLTKINTFSNSMRKEPERYTQSLNHLAIFKVLHKKEYENVIMQYHDLLPQVAPVFYYDECYTLFKKIPIQESYALALKELKRRDKTLIEAFNSVPHELRYLFYFFKPSLKDYVGLKNFLHSSYGA